MLPVALWAVALIGAHVLGALKPTKQPAVERFVQMHEAKSESVATVAAVTDFSVQRQVDGTVDPTNQAIYELVVRYGPHWLKQVPSHNASSVQALHKNLGCVDAKLPWGGELLILEAVQVQEGSTTYWVFLPPIPETSRCLSTQTMKSLTSQCFIRIFLPSALQLSKLRVMVPGIRMAGSGVERVMAERSRAQYLSKCSLVPAILKSSM